MAVSLPVVMLAYEALENPPRRWAWLWTQARLPMIGGAITALFIGGRMWGTRSLASMDAYRPAPSLETYFARAAHWIREALYDPGPYVFAAAVTVLVAAPLFCRSKALRLSFVWMAAGILPIAFIPERGIAQAYIPAYALALFVAVGVERALARVPFGQLVMLGLLPALVFWWHSRNGRLDYAVMNEAGAHIRTVYEQLDLLQPAMPKGSRVLFARDPFPDNDWASTFLVYLYSRDPSLQAIPVKEWMKQTDQRQFVDFDVVLSYEDGKLLQCDTGAFRQVAIRELPQRHCEPVAIAYPNGTRAPERRAANISAGGFVYSVDHGVPGSRKPAQTFRGTDRR
jgi:hypothetical protein